MDADQVKKGMTVRVGKLGTTDGMAIAQRHLDARKEGATGTVINMVSGHGGDVWWVRHTNRIAAAYSHEELDPVLEEIPPQG